MELIARVVTHRTAAGRVCHGIATGTGRLPLAERPQLRAAALMLVATLLLTLMHTLVRYLSAGLHPFEIAFFRNLFGLLAVLPLLARAGPGSLRTRQPGIQLARGLLGVVAMLALVLRAERGATGRGHGVEL